MAKKLYFSISREDFYSSTVKLGVPGSKKALENLKYEIANELGISLGANQTSRLNGSVGGEMTKRLVELGKKYYNETQKNS